MKSNDYTDFQKLSVDERLKCVADFAGLSESEISTIKEPGYLTEDLADHMVENMIGRFSLPMGVALNFIINGREVVIPMVSEEPSVIASCSYAAKLARAGGGFATSSTGNIMISQIQMVGIEAPSYARQLILEHKEEIIRICNEKDPILVKCGGGARDVEVRFVETKAGTMVIVHLLVDTMDAMGANAVNTMAEAAAPYLEKLTGGRAALRILSNYAVHRVVRARAVFKKEDIGGEDVVDKMLCAYAFAEADPYRAVTNNKGIMNGIIPVVMATGNDTRAIEAGAHAYACRNGSYTSLTTWEKDGNGDLVGMIELPMAVGLVGGATKILPAAQVAVKMLGVESASELGQIIAAVGLAANMTVMKVLATGGIQKYHMASHARNLAATAGATGDVLEAIVKKMVSDDNVHLEYAQELFKEYQK